MILSLLMSCIRCRFLTGLAVAAGVVAASETLTQSAPAVRAASPSPDAQQITNTIRTYYYDVHGVTAEELLASLRASRPFTKHASTGWRVAWNYDYLVRSDGYVLRCFNVRVQVTFTLPLWLDSERADKTLQEEWKRYYAALQIHESGHAGFAIAAGKEMLRRMNSREWRAADRKELKAAIDDECNKTLQEFRTQEVAYDEKTNHGRTQGARLRTAPQ